jgi:hypothetical protein
MFSALALVHLWIHRLVRPSSSDRGQTTAEYALVLVVVAAIALLVLAWATESGAIGKLFDFILSHIMGQVH